MSHKWLTLWSRAISRTEQFTDTVVLAKQSSASSFGVAIKLLPADLRIDFYLLYFVFDTIDNLVDECQPDALERVGAIEAWCQSGLVKSRETEVLSMLSQRYDLPRQALNDFCRAMRLDLAGGTFTTEEELDNYCYCAGGTVGLLLTSVLGTKGSETEEKAIALGMAAQRTNILRDIDEDFANGRVYLATETIDRFGSITPGQRAALLRDQIARADLLFEQGMAGIPLLQQGQRAVTTAAVLYREILRQIERDGYGEKPGRVVVPRWRKQLIVARCHLQT